MNRYKCPACEGDQFSSSSDKAAEPCVYCGNDGTELQEDIEDQDEIIAIAKSMESGGDI